MHASQAKGLEGLEEASRRRYLHVRPRLECGTVAALQIQNRLVDASLDRGRDAPLPAEMPEKAWRASAKSKISCSDIPS
jgi:hypothetical protein